MTFKRLRFFVLMVVLAALSLAACQKDASTPTAASSPSPQGLEATVEPAPTATATPIPATATPAVLPPDPQRVTFQGEHGTMVGYYYPADRPQAPVIVLMHWAPGDQRDWCLLAPWLQNRAAEHPALMPGCEEAIAKADPLPAWWDASWFPPMPEGTSYAVFTFDFPGFGESKAAAYTDVTVRYQPHRQREEWNISQGDLVAALETAAALSGVDSNRVVTVGVSIGADGAMEGCAAFNQLHAGAPRCVGAWAISPGDYLGLSFAEAVDTLGARSPETVKWCATSWSEKQSCTQAQDGLQQVILFPKGHGMTFFGPSVYPMKPGRDATVMDFLLEFLQSLP